MHHIARATSHAQRMSRTHKETLMMNPLQLQLPCLIMYRSPCPLESPLTWGETTNCSVWYSDHHCRGTRCGIHHHHQPNHNPSQAKTNPNQEESQESLPGQRWTTNVNMFQLANYTSTSHHAQAVNTRTHYV